MSKDMENEGKDVEVMGLLDGLDAVTVFQKENGADQIIRLITEKMDGVVFDLTTVKGKKDCASAARKVASSKVFLDNLGKTLVADWKEKAKVVDNQRAKIRDSLDALRDKIRKPLTDLEAAEEAKKKAIADRLKVLVDARNVNGLGINLLTERLFAIADEKLTFERFEDSLTSAKKFQEDALEVIKARITELKKIEADQAEIAKLKKERDEAERKEREAEIERKASEKARIEAEQKAKREAEAKEREHREEILRVERENARKIAEAKEAQDRAERIKQANEAERIKTERERAANEEHRLDVKCSVVTALQLLGVEDETANVVFDAIKNGEILHVTLNY